MSKTCSITGCESKHYGNGLCERHNRRRWTYGDPLHTRSCGSYIAPRKGFIKDGIGYIPLTKGHFVQVDPHKLAFLTQWNWYASIKPSGVYARRSDGVRLHRFLMNPAPGVQVDHINRIPSDCRLHNLRLCSPAENSCNRASKPQSSSRFKGVTWNPDRNKWSSQIWRGTNFWIADSDSEEDAAIYYNVAAQLFQGQFAYLNQL